MHIDLLLIGSFLVLILVVGLRPSKKIESFADYAVGEKNFRDWVLVGSLVATIFGGRIMDHSMSYGYRKDIITFMIPLLLCLNYFLIGKVFSIRIKEFLLHLSIAESMGSLYGRMIRVVTAIAGVSYTFGRLTIEFYVLYQTINIFFHIHSHTTTIAIAIIVIIYASLGGARAVVATDIVQFLIFCLFLPTIFLIILYKIEQPHNFVEIARDNPTLQLQAMITGEKNFQYLFMFCNIIPLMTPPEAQRIYMTKNTSQIERVFLQGAYLRFILILLIIGVGLLLFIDNTTLTPQNLINHTISASHYPVVKILFFMTILGLIISTADSNLHVASIFFTHDIVEVIHNKSLLNKTIWSRIFSFILGTFALLFSLKIGYKQLQLVLFYLINFYTTIVTVPFVISILGFRPHRKSVLIGIVASCIMIFGWHYTSITPITALLLILGGDLLSIFGSHYLLPKIPNTGWIGIKDQAPLLAVKQASTRKWEARRKNFKGFSVSAYLRNIFPEDLSCFFKVGLYADIAIIVAILSIPIRTTTYLACFAPIMALATFFMFYPALKKKRGTKKVYSCTMDGYWVLLSCYL